MWQALPEIQAIQNLPVTQSRIAKVVLVLPDVYCHFDNLCDLLVRSGGACKGNVITAVWFRDLAGPVFLRRRDTLALPGFRGDLRSLASDSCGRGGISADVTCACSGRAFVCCGALAFRGEYVRYNPPRLRVQLFESTESGVGSASEMVVSPAR